MVRLESGVKKRYNKETKWESGEKMKTVMILFDSEQFLDAEHAKGVLEEELDTYRIHSLYIGKEVLHTESVQYIFRDINHPTIANMHMKFDVLYATENLKKNTLIEQYISKTDAKWIKEPTSGIVDYVLEAKEFFTDEKVVRYEIEQQRVILTQVENYKADRTGYFKTKEEAESYLQKYRKENETSDVTAIETKSSKKKDKKILVSS